MYTLYKILLFTKIVGNSIQQGYTGHPQSFRIKQIQEILADNHGWHDQCGILRINIHLLCQGILCFVNRIFVTIHELCLGDDIVLALFPEKRFCKEISHEDHIFDIPVFEIKPLKASKIIADKFFHQLRIIGSGLFQFFQTLTDTHTTHFQTLGGHKGILIKQGNLQVASPHIQNGSSLLDHFLESIFNGCYGFVTQKMLLCVAQNFHMDPGSSVDLLNNDNGIFHFTEYTGGAGAIFFYSILCHDPAEII